MPVLSHCHFVAANIAFQLYSLYKNQYLQADKYRLLLDPPSQYSAKSLFCCCAFEFLAVCFWLPCSISARILMQTCKQTVMPKPDIFSCLTKSLKVLYGLSKAGNPITFKGLASFISNSMTFPVFHDLYEPWSSLNSITLLEKSKRENTQQTYKHARKDPNTISQYHKLPKTNVDCAVVFWVA